jgi:4'-phosphopantetheinyl transferase
MTRLFAEDKVCVLWAEIPRHRQRLAALGKHLSADESERAARFHRAADRERFVLGRGLLREALAGHLRVAPRDLSFSYNRWGKPGLDGFARLEFNVSHAHDLVALAFTLGRKVGIDLERVDRAVDALKLAERFFTAEEAAALRALDGPRRSAEFFRCWTRKEAFVKAHGRGLSRPLEPDDAERAHWTTVEVPCPNGYVAHLCAEAGTWRVVVAEI